MSSGNCDKCTSSTHFTPHKLTHPFTALHEQNIDKCNKFVNFLLSRSHVGCFGLYMQCIASFYMSWRGLVYLATLLCIQKWMPGLPVKLNSKTQSAVILPISMWNRFMHFCTIYKVLWSWLVYKFVRLWTKLHPCMHINVELWVEVVTLSQFVL